MHYLSSLLNLGQHDNHRHLLLPDHPPEIVHRVLHGPLGDDVCVLLLVALNDVMRATS